MANLFKKVFAGASAMAVVVASMNIGAMVSAANLVSAEFTAAYTWGFQNGVTTMSSEEAFAPFNGITREQSAKFVVNGLIAAGVEVTLDPNANCTFGDSATFDPTLVDSINAACGYGLIRGYGGNYHPKDVVTRGQWMTMLGRALYGQQAEPAEYWTNYYSLLKADGIFTIENAYNDVLRYEAMLTLFRIASDKNEAIGDDDNLDSILCQLIGTCDDATDNTTDDTMGTGTVDNGPDLSDVAGSLHVALSPASPVGGFIPNKGSNINVMKVDFLAGDDAIQLNAVTVKLEGFMARTSITKVFFVDADGIPLTNERAFTSDYTARAVFEKKFVVPANEVRSLYLYVATDSGLSNEVFNLSIPAMESVDANTDAVTGNFPIRSNTFQTTAYSSTTVGFNGEKTDATAVGSITQELNIGETNKRVGKFDLNIGSENNRDIKLQTITLRNADVVEGVLDNVKLTQGANANVAKAVIIDGKYITFVIQDDFVMKYGDSKAFYIYADIIGGEANDVVQFRLDQTTDISAFEVDTNAALFVQIEGSEDYLEAYKLIEGDNIITRRSDSPSSRFIPNDADYETVLIANLYLSAAMDIDNFRVFRDSTSTALATDIDNVRLYINGRQIDSVSTTGGVDGTYGSYYEFSTFETLQGSNEIRVAVDTTQAAVDGRNFKVTIRPQSIVFGSNAEYVSSQNTVPVADISGIADGGTMTIKKPAVQNVTRTDSYGSAEEVVKGANNFEMIKFAVQANAAGRDLIINSFNVVANVTSGVSTAAVYVDGKMVDTTSFGGVTASFSSLDINVPQGGTTEVSVMVSINTSYLTGAPLVFTVNSFDVDDSEGNTVTNSATVTSATFTVLDSASLIGLINNDTPDKAVITAGTTYDVAYFELEAISDDALVQELTFLNVANAYALDVATGGVATITGADGAIVYAYDAAGNLLGTSTLAEGVAYFSFANPILLERENDGTLIVLKVQPKAINNQTDTNATIKFAVLEVGETVAGTQRTFITSVANGEAITAGNTTWTKAYSETQYVRKTNLVVSNVTAPTSTLLTNGIGKELFAFNAASNNGAKALVKELRIDVDLGGNARLSSFEIYQGNTKLTASQATFVESTANCSTTAVVATLTGGDNCLSIVFTGTYVNGYEVSSSKKFTLRASVAGATAGGDSVSMRISEVSTTATKFTHTGATAELTSLVWSDRAADNTTLTSVDWFTDAFVEVIPTNSWSFSASN